MWREVGHVPHAGIRVDEGETFGAAVRVGGNGPDLADEAGRGFFEGIFALELQELQVEARQGVDHGREDGHGLGLDRESLEVVLEGLVQGGVASETGTQAVDLLPLGKTAKDQQPRHFHETRLLCQLLDGDAPITEDALLAVDERDLAQARACVAERRVEGDVTGLGAKLGNVDGPLALGTLHDGELERLVTDSQDRIFRHGVPPSKVV